MLTKMYHKVIENYISAICGVFGFGISWTQIHWPDALMRLLIAIASAFLAGAVGYLGKITTVYFVGRIRIFFSRFKK